MWIIRPDYEYMGRSVGRIVFMFKQLANLQSAMAAGQAWGRGPPGLLLGSFDPKWSGNINKSLKRLNAVQQQQHSSSISSNSSRRATAASVTPPRAAHRLHCPPPPLPLHIATYITWWQPDYQWTHTGHGTERGGRGHWTHLEHVCASFQARK